MTQQSNVSRLWEKTYWTSPINFLSNIYIREYDISKANINILLNIGAIDQTMYNFLYNLEKQAREVYAGMMMKDRKEEKLPQAILKGIREARQLFFEANDIHDEEVISIKNDAIYLVGKIPSVTSFGNITFNNKHWYTSYYRLERRFNIEFYYRLDIPRQIELLDIKGINKEVLSLHEPYMIDFLKTLFYTVEVEGVEVAISLLQNFAYNYLNRELPIGYYRRLSSLSGYETNMTNTLGARYIISGIDESYLSNIEIGYNYSILMNLYKYLASMYFNKK